MNEINFNDTPAGRKLLSKSIETAKKTQKQIYNELDKIAEDGRPDVSCELAFEIIEQLIKGLKRRSLFLEEGLSVWSCFTNTEAIGGGKRLHKRVAKVRDAIEILFEELNSIIKSENIGITRDAIFDTTENLMSELQRWHLEIASVFKEKKNIPLF